MKWPGSLESCHQSPLDGKSEVIVESWKSKYPALNVVGDRFSGSEYLDECGDNVGIAWVMRSSSELAIAIRDSLRQGNAQLVDKGGANLSADRGPFFVLLGRDVMPTTREIANTMVSPCHPRFGWLILKDTSPSPKLPGSFTHSEKTHILCFCIIHQLGIEC